jgi:hypothetical protein
MAHEPICSPLNDTQLLLLDTLIYRFDREVTVAIGQSVGRIVRDLDTGLKERMARDGAKMDAQVGEQMTYAHWFAVIDAIRRDDVLRRLQLAAYQDDDRGARMACFTDDGRNDPAASAEGQGAPDSADQRGAASLTGRNGALGVVRPSGKRGGRGAAAVPMRCGYVIFAGTGTGEWPDNCAAAYLADSEQQLRALDWFEHAVVPLGFDRVVTSGHSKGGNKAMYLAVQAAEHVDATVSFDGQGFSRQFLAAYAPAIRANTGKIRAYALDNDFVNGLLNPISKPENRFYLKGEHADVPFEYHAPFSLLKPVADDPHRLMLRDATKQSQLGQVSVAFTDYMQSQADDHDLRHVCDYLGGLLECTTRSSWADGERRQRLVELSQSPDLNLTAGYLADFLKQMGRNVSVRDMRLVLLGGGTEDSLDPQTLAAIAVAKLPGALQDLFNQGDANGATNG